MTSDSIISKVWSFCHTLRDDRLPEPTDLAEEIIENIEAGWPISAPSPRRCNADFHW